MEGLLLLRGAWKTKRGWGDTCIKKNDKWCYRRQHGWAKDISNAICLFCIYVVGWDPVELLSTWMVSWEKNQPNKKNPNKILFSRPVSFWHAKKMYLYSPKIFLKTNKKMIFPNISLNLIIRSIRKCNPEYTVPLSPLLIMDEYIHTLHKDCVFAGCNAKEGGLLNNRLLPMGLKCFWKVPALVYLLSHCCGQLSFMKTPWKMVNHIVFRWWKW